MIADSKMRRNFIFSIFTILVVLILLEYTALVGIRNFFSQSDLRANRHPLLEFDQDLGYRVRSNIFNDPKLWFWVLSKSGGKFHGIISFIH